MKNIREAISENRFDQFRKDFLEKYFSDAERIDWEKYLFFYRNYFIIITLWKGEIYD